MISFDMGFPFVLRKGHSPDPRQGACAMDAINWLVHGKHGDAPECACPIITSYVINGNDLMFDDTRQELIQYLPRIAGSRSEDHQKARNLVLVQGATQVVAANALMQSKARELGLQVRHVENDLYTMTDLLNYVKEAIWKIANNDKDVNMFEAIRAVETALRVIDTVLWSEKTNNVMTSETAGKNAGIMICKTINSISISQNDELIWNWYFTILDMLLKAGPEGEPWSADQIEIGVDNFVRAGGKLVGAEL